MMRALPALLLLGGACALFTCPVLPPTRQLPPRFQGLATRPSEESILTTGTTLWVIPVRDSISSQYCIVDAFVNPNKPGQAFVTIGSLANAAADIDVACAFLDISTKATVRFNLTLDSNACPMAPEGVSYSWVQPSTLQPACPQSDATMPSSLLGSGNLTDDQNSGNSRLLVEAGSWTTVMQGSLVSSQCISSAVPVGETPAYELKFSNAKKGMVEACVWAAPSSTSTLTWKAGKGSACPSDFTDATVTPFVFAT